MNPHPQETTRAALAELLAAGEHADQWERAHHSEMSWRMLCAIRAYAALSASQVEEGEALQPSWKATALATARRVAYEHAWEPAPLSVKESLTVVEPVAQTERNNPMSALAIRLLVAAGHVTQEKADQAFHIACYATQEEAKRMGEELPWVAIPKPVDGEPVAQGSGAEAMDAQIACIDAARATAVAALLGISASHAPVAPSPTWASSSEATAP